MARAPSVHLHFNDSQHGDILTHTALIPDYADAVNTYYCCMNWNNGVDGGGYCGLQHRSDGTCFIYSLWNPPHSHEPVRLIYHSPSTQVAHFGGEGTGLRSLNFNFGWYQNHWYTLVSRVWTEGGASRFGFWVKDQSAGKWEHLVVFEYPRANVKFTSDTAAFVEDFIGNGQDVRGLWLKDGFRRTHPGSWVGMTSAGFTMVHEASSAQHDGNYDAEARETMFYLATGGKVQPSPGLAHNHQLKLSGSTPSHPSEPNIAFYLTKATTHGVSWYVPATSTPQFGYSVKVNGHVVASGNDAERRSANYQASRGQKVEVTLEDVYGNHTTQSHTAQ